jgi:predicted outer membrane protein
MKLGPRPNGRPWTPQEDAQLLALLESKMDRDLIARKLKRTVTAIKNAALFEQEIQNGSDPDLKEFARQTLPKIVDHLHRAEKLAAAGEGRLASK